MKLLDEYKEYRKRVRDLHHNILKLVSSNDMKKVAKILGILENGNIVIESPEEQDAHMDFSVYADIHGDKSKLAMYMKGQA